MHVLINKLYYHLSLPRVYNTNTPPYSPFMLQFQITISMS